MSALDAAGGLAAEARSLARRAGARWTLRLIAPQRVMRYLPLIAIAGAAVAAGQVVWWSSLGAWPFHDSAAFWLAGRRILGGVSPYQGDGLFLAFVYAPPWAVLFAPIALLPLEVFTALLLAAQVLAFRYVAGSWTVAGLLCWLPFVPRALVTGNIDLIMAAAILAGIRGHGVPLALFALAKASPVLAVTRRTLVTFVVAAAVLVALSAPWLHLWPEWAVWMTTIQRGGPPWLVRAPAIFVLLALRRPWARAAAAGLATPAFWEHSWVLLLPALRLVTASIAQEGVEHAKLGRHFVEHLPVPFRGREREEVRAG